MRLARSMALHLSWHNAHTKWPIFRFLFIYFSLWFLVLLFCNKFFLMLLPNDQPATTVTEQLTTRRSPAVQANFCFHSWWWHGVGWTETEIGFKNDHLLFRALHFVFTMLINGNSTGVYKDLTRFYSQFKNSFHFIWIEWFKCFFLHFVKHFWLNESKSCSFVLYLVALMLVIGYPMFDIRNSIELDT